MAHNYSKIYVLKCQSLGHKTVKEVWNFGGNFVARTKWWLNDTEV